MNKRVVLLGKIYKKLITFCLKITENQLSAYFINLQLFLVHK